MVLKTDMLRDPLRPALSPALRSPLEPGVGSIWSAAYSFALGVLPAAIAALTRGGLATRIGPTGNVEYGPCNLLIGAGTQSVTVTAVAHTLTLRGTGSITLSGTATGILTGTGVNDRVSLTFTPTAGTLTLTVSGSITLPRLQLGTVSRAEDDALLVTTSVARFLPRIEHSPVSPFSPVGLLVEGQAVNRVSSNFANWVIQASGWTLNPGATTGMDGAPADTFTESTTSVSRSIYRAPSSPASGATTFTLGFKKISGANRWMRMVIGSSASDFATVTVNMQTGSVAEAAQTFGTASAASGSAYVTESGWVVATLTATLAAAIALDFLIPLDAPTPGHNAGDWDRMVYLGTGAVIALDRAQDEAGSVATSYIPNPTTGTMVRVGDFSGGGFTGAALTDLITPTSPFTLRFCYRKAYSQASNETLFGLCAGATAGGTNQLQLVTNGTQARLIHSGGSGLLTGTLTHNGTTTNVIAVSVDPTALGAERIPNPGFANASFWGLDAGVTIGGGVCTFASVANGQGAYNVSFDARGNRVEITYTVVSVSGGGFGIYLNGTSTQTRNAPGTYTETVTAGTSDTIVVILARGTTSGVVDNISIREVGVRSISVNGSTPVEATGSAYTGAGVTAMVLGARNSAGTDPAVRFTVDTIQANRTYTTGAALQALSV
jgi:hypothetical protein